MLKIHLFKNICIIVRSNKNEKHIKLVGKSVSGGFI